MFNIFDNLIVEDENGGIAINKWIEWSHPSLPNEPEVLRLIVKKLLNLLGHCLECTTLDGCYMVERNMPAYPLHKNCDCNKIGISFSKVKSKANAVCDIRKFTQYVFKDEIVSKGKNKLFSNMGFNISDSEYLKHEYEKQALKEYLKGNYILKELDSFGQRLSIPISLNGKEFLSGWLLCPEGKIKNTTPFGGWLDES